jgi:Transposase DDE domain
LYAQFLRLVQPFSCLGAWQKRALALWCSGVVLAEACQLTAVADALVSPQRPSVEALVKRLSRFLSNPRISDELLSRTWVEWIAQTYASPHWVILVDETKLSDHLSVMMVGLAYRQRAIPLLWRCYRPDAYPAEGQVALIGELLTRLRLWLPAGLTFTVQADRGIGTSPDLIRQLTHLDMLFLLRVQGQTRLRLSNGRTHPLASLVKPGEIWCGQAEVFKKAGWLRLYVRLAWRRGEKTPWCLVTNCRWRRSRDYALRGWHEHSFRDLKSFGFKWNASQVWQPAHAHRLLFVLALAYTWILSQAALYTPDEHLSPSRTAPRQSLFRRGLRWFRQQVCRPLPGRVSPNLYFRPETPLLC